MRCVTNALQIHNQQLRIVRFHFRGVGKLNLIRHHEYQMLYLNMLYDIIGCGIAQGFQRIILGRTALEIKSSIGAKPIKLNGFMHHSFSIVHQNLSWIFPFLEPKKPRFFKSSRMASRNF